MTRIEELTVREGQDVAEEWPWVAAGETPCAAFAWKDGRSYECTRARHDDGPHVAHVPGPSAVCV